MTSVGCSLFGGDDTPTTTATSLALPTVTTEAAPVTSTPGSSIGHPLARLAPPPFDPVAWKLATEGGQLPEPPPPPPPAEVGDAVSFFYGDGGQVHEIDAELVYANEDVTMWFATDVAYDLDTVAAAADRFANELMPVVVRLIGPVPDPGIDGDRRVAILHHNQLGDSAGEFASYDLLPRALFPDSNEREMLYVAGDLVVGSDLHLGTLTHELVHLIDYSTRPNRPLWFAEGIAQLAEHAAGLDSVLAHLTYLAHEPIQLNDWGPLQLDDRHYGASYLFFVYLWERYGDAVIADVMASPFEGMAAIGDALRSRDTDLTTFFADWVAAVALDARVPDQGMQALRLPEQCGLERIETLPAALQDTVPQFAPRFASLTGTGIVDLSFEGSATVGPIPAEAFGGEWMWWAGPSDESAATLTRELDLRGLRNATLRFSTWHDTGYTDAAVVLVSADRGTTWTVAAGSASQPVTIGDLSGINGYTGWSGSGSEPEWVTETIDLSDHAGGTVLVRFQYTTDLYEGRIGFALDDISLVELEGVDGAEDDASEWVADGFQRVPQSARQPWALQVLDDDGVERVEVTDGRGAFRVDLGDGGSAIVAVAATASGIGTTAEYTLRASGSAQLTSASGDPAIETFDLPCTGWELESTPSYDLERADGRMVISAHGADAFTWSARDGIHDVVTVSADMTFERGEDGAGGLMCRLSAAGFYEINVASDGTYLIGVAFADDYEVLVDWTESSLIDAGLGATNVITLGCEDGSIRAAVNGETLAVLDDDRLPPGEVALVGASYANPTFVVAYDNVEIVSDRSLAPGLVSFDDFTNPSDQWPPFNDRGSRTGPAAGEYVLSVLTDDWSAEAYSTDSFGDVAFSADFRVTGLAPDGLIGAACHTSKLFDQYLFLLAFDGSYAVQGVVGEDFVDIVPWTFGSGLRVEPQAVNHMEVVCAGGRLVWTLNGWVLADVENDALEGGHIGFIAYSYDYGQLEMRIDNVRIVDPAVP